MGVHMKLDDSQRMIGIKSTVLTIFRLDIWDKRYNELQQVYEALNLKTNSKLVNKLTLNEHRDIASFFTDTVYMDIAFVIDDCISTRTDIIELVGYMLKDFLLSNSILERWKGNMHYIKALLI